MKEHMPTGRTGNVPFPCSGLYLAYSDTRKKQGTLECVSKEVYNEKSFFMIMHYRGEAHAVYP